MTHYEWLAIMPMTTLAVTSVVLMLLLCIVRSHILTCLVTLIGLFSTFWNVSFSQDVIDTTGTSIAITPLFIVDHYFIFFSKLIVFACFVCALQIFQYFRHSKPAGHNVEEFYILLVLACLGALVLVSAQHFAGFFLGLEIMGIALFVMIAFPVGCFRESNSAVRHSLEAAFKYLILSSVASAFLLLGMAFIYAKTGTLSFVEMHTFLNLHDEARGLFIPLALALLLIGIGFKLSLVPFHLWTPDVYQGAPTPVTALIATVSKGAVVAVLMRFFIVMDALRYEAVMAALSVLAIATMLVGNFLALTQDNIKRILAYSSIAHVGYLLVAFIAVADLKQEGSSLANLSIEAVAFYIAAYFVTTLGAFGVVSAVSEQGLLIEQRYDLRRYQGLFWRHPWVASCFILMLLSLAGIPLTMGFIGKFYIFAAGAQSELWGLLLTVVLGSAIGLYYYLRIIIILVQKERVDSSSPYYTPASYASSGWLENIIIFSLTGLLLFFGIYPTPLIDWVQLI